MGAHKTLKMKPPFSISAQYFIYSTLALIGGVYFMFMLRSAAIENSLSRITGEEDRPWT